MSKQATTVHDNTIKPTAPITPSNGASNITANKIINIIKLTIDQNVNCPTIVLGHTPTSITPKSNGCVTVKVKDCDVLLTPSDSDTSQFKTPDCDELNKL